MLAVLPTIDHPPVIFGPNITGTVDWSNAGNPSASGKGALYWAMVDAAGTHVTDEGYPANISIDASRSNSIYGNSTTVQPPSRYALMIIKA